MSQAITATLLVAMLAAVAAAQEKGKPQERVLKNVDALIGSDLTWSKSWVEQRDHPTRSRGAQRVVGMRGYQRIPVQYDCERIQSAAFSLQRGEKAWHQGQAWVVWTDVATDVNREGDKRRGVPAFTHRAYRGYFSVHAGKDKNVMVLRLSMVKHFTGVKPLTTRKGEDDGIEWTEQKFAPCGIDLEFSIDDGDAFPEALTFSVATEGFCCDSAGSPVVRRHEPGTVKELITGGEPVKARPDFVRPGSTIKTVSKAALAKLFAGDKKLSTDNTLLVEPFSGDLPAGFRERPDAPARPARKK